MSLTLKIDYHPKPAQALEQAHGIDGHRELAKMFFESALLELYRYAIARGCPKAKARRALRNLDIQAVLEEDYMMKDNPNYTPPGWERCGNMIISPPRDIPTTNERRVKDA